MSKSILDKKCLIIFWYERLVTIRVIQMEASLKHRNVFTNSVKLKILNNTDTLVNIQAQNVCKEKLFCDQRQCQKIFFFASHLRDDVGCGAGTAAACRMRRVAAVVAKKSSTQKRER